MMQPIRVVWSDGSFCLRTHAVDSAYQFQQMQRLCLAELRALAQTCGQASMDGFNHVDKALLVGKGSRHADRIRQGVFKPLQR